MNLLNELELDSKHINSAYEEVLDLLKDIGMDEEANAILDELPEKLKQTNIFSGWSSVGFYPYPTDIFIGLIYDLAREKIEKKYPTCCFKIVVKGYNSSFDIDSDTYDKAWREARRYDE